MNRCIINFANDRGPYLQWQQRLVSTVAPFGIDVIAWRNKYPPGSPTHEDCPYGFKLYAFRDAAEQGYESILWCDSSIWARKDPSPIFDLIEHEGHVFFRNGYNCGQWCHDAALTKMGLSRDEAMAVPDLVGGCIGLDMTNYRSKAFYEQWKAAADDGVSFPGAWKNDDRQCSADPRCCGHRHDQVIASIIAHRMEMKLTNAGELVSFWTPPLADSVCLVIGGQASQ